MSMRLRPPVAALLALLALSGTAARADVYITPKHLLIIRQGLDAVFGSYVFAVQNTDEQPAHFKAKVMLPKETDDFSPQEGVEPDQVTLAPEGGVVVEKDFGKGVEIVSIGFKVPSAFGRGVLTLTPTTDIQSLTVLVPRLSGMTIASATLAPAATGAAPDPQYEAMQNIEPLKAGTTFTIEVSGLPEGRTRIWIVGSAVAAMLVVMAGIMALRTRPKITEDAGEAVLTG